MDITPIFLEALNSVKAFHNEMGKGHMIKTGKPVSKIFPKRKNLYHRSALEIMALVVKLNELIEETKPAYLNFGTKLSIRFFQPEMEDEERDQVDIDIQSIIKSCQGRIQEFETFLGESGELKSFPQFLGHLKIVRDSLKQRLKKACTSYSEMKAIRVKRTLDYKNVSKLLIHEAELNQKGQAISAATKMSSASKIVLENGGVAGESSSKKSLNRSSQNENKPQGPDLSSYFVEEEISDDEMQMLEEENALLLQELTSQRKEAALIESSVVQIAELQEIFTEKVLEQEKDIDRISTMVVNTTENIKTGNEQIRQAIQKNADFRAWVLLFLLIMSFSLLFLDWYND